MDTVTGIGRPKPTEEEKRKAKEREEASKTEYWENQELKPINTALNHALRETEDIDKDYLYHTVFFPTRDERRLGNLLATHVVMFNHHEDYKTLPIRLDSDTDMNELIRNPEEDIYGPKLERMPEIKGVGPGPNMRSPTLLKQAFAGWYSEETIQGNELRTPQHEAYRSNLPSVREFSDVGHILNAYALRSDGRIGRLKIPVNEEAVSDLERELRIEK